MSKKVQKELMSLKSKVGKLEKQDEVKEFNVFVHNTYTNLTQAGEQRVIGGLTQGTDYNQRIGREIKPYSVSVNLNLRGAQTAGAVANPVPYRIILVQDRGYNGNVRPLSQILEGSSSIAGQHDNYLAGYNDDYVRTSPHNKQNPVTILKDKRGFISPVLSGYGKTQQALNMHVSGRYLSKLSYSGVNSTDLQAGAIILYVWTGTSATASENNQYILKHTIRYLDA